MAKEIKQVAQVQAVLSLPGSKSFTHRALIAAALADGESVLINALKAEDTEITAQALARMGAGIDWHGATVRIRGTGGHLKPVPSPISLANSGTSMRFLTALAALGQGPYNLVGSPRLCERPMGELLTALGQLGVQAVSAREDGCPPVIVYGGLPGGHAQLSGAVSSQYLSALLLIGPLAGPGVEITITGELVSRPYADMTLRVMADFGVSYYREGYRYFRLPGGQHYEAREYEIEADASSASYFWAAAALTCGRVAIANLRPDSCQGDVSFLEVLEQMGCRVLAAPEGLTVEGGPLKAVRVDMSAMPDLVPTLAVLAAFAQGETTVTGVAHLRHKESDRLAAVATELQKMGINARETADGLIIPGGRPHGANIDTYRDHRIAMSFAVAGLVAEGETVVEGAEWADISFPGFFDLLGRLSGGAAWTSA